MPYIADKKFRNLYDGYLTQLVSVLSRVPKKKQHGHLNYIITRLILEIKPEGYKELNAILGVLESVKFELYRRKIAPYEDEKIIENGDVY